MAKELDIAEPTVIRGEELRTRGFGGLYGVGKAAEVPPALVVLSWTPGGPDGSTETVALVGKGIVYDTGGLSIKARVSLLVNLLNVDTVKFNKQSCGLQLVYNIKLS